jgi:hypothetical protein
MAEAVVDAFVRSWGVLDILSRLGCGSVDDEEAAAAIHAQFPFMPGDIWAYRKNTPVRALVASEWPKLSEYLYRYSKDAERLAKVVPQVMRLVCTDKERQVRTTAEYRENYKLNTKVRNQRTVRDLTTVQRESHGRSAWHVCKK